MNHGFPPPPPNHGPTMNPKVHHIGSQFERMHLHHAMNPQHNDIHSLSSAELDPPYNPSVDTPGGNHKESISYEAYNLTKLNPDSWARVRRTPIHLSQKELRAEVINRKARGPSALKQYTKLAKAMRGQVDRLIEDRNSEEMDLNVKYELAAMKIEKRNVGRRESETVSIQIILRRRLQPRVTQEAPNRLNVPGEIVDLHARPTPQPPIMMPGGGRERQHYEPHPPHEQGAWTPGPLPDPYIVDDRFPQQESGHDVHFPPQPTPHIQHMQPPQAYTSPPEAPTPPKAAKREKNDKKDDKKDSKKEHEPRVEVIEVHHIHKPKSHKRVDKWFKDLPDDSDYDTGYDSFSETTTPTSVSGHSYDHKPKHRRLPSPHRSGGYREHTREHRRKAPLPSPHSRRPMSHHEDHRETVPARTHPLPSSRRMTGYIAERPQYHIRTRSHEDDRYYEDDRHSEAPLGRLRVLDDHRLYEHNRCREPPVSRTRMFEDGRLYDKHYEPAISRPRWLDTATYREDSLRRREGEREQVVEDYMARKSGRDYVR